MHLEAGWTVVGIVTEKRELKSEKNATWRGYICKVATVGFTAEIAVTPEQFGQVGEGQHLRFDGRFELQSGFLKQIALKIGPGSAKAGAA